MPTKSKLIAQRDAMIDNLRNRFKTFYVNITGFHREEISSVMIVPASEKDYNLLNDPTSHNQKINIFILPSSKDVEIPYGSQMITTTRSYEIPLIDLKNQDPLPSNEINFREASD